MDIIRVIFNVLDIIHHDTQNDVEYHPNDIQQL